MSTSGQMPLAFSNESPVVLEARLAGMSIYARVRGPVTGVAHILQEVGIDCSPEGAEIRIAVRHLQRALERSDLVEIVPEGPLKVIVDLLNNPPAENAPVLITADSKDTLNLSWPSESFEHNEPFPAASSAALLAAGISVVAHPEAWSKLAGAGSIPLPLAYAHVNRERFVEIKTPAPHRLLSTSLPALFQTSESSYGMPLAYASRLRAAEGVVWSGPLPAPEPEPPAVEKEYSLSRHAEEDLDKLAGKVNSSFGQAVVWSSGLGRRMFALAAIDRLDSWPCTILCLEDQIWPWHRLAGLIGRTIATTHARQDIHLLTYKQAGKKNYDSPTALIFDQYDEMIGMGADLRGHIEAYNTLMDPYRIVLARELPQDPEHLKCMMSLVRPAEFPAERPVQMLYPERMNERLKEHTACYLSHRTDRNTTPSGFPSSGVIQAYPGGRLKKILSEVLGEDRDVTAKVAEALNIVSRGTGSVLSPKIAIAVERMSRYAESGSTLSVVANSSTTLEIISSLSRETLAKAEGRITLHEAGRKEPESLRTRNRVLFVDYPSSFSYIDRMVGRLGEAGCPRSVEIIHMRDSTDDRIASICAVRHETEGLVDPDRPYSDSELTAIAESPAGQ